MNDTNNLDQCVRSSLEAYFDELEGEEPRQVWDMVNSCVEKTVLEFIMEKTLNNQTQASTILGITRNTLRKKLIKYDLI